MAPENRPDQGGNVDPEEISQHFSSLPLKIDNRKDVKFFKPLKTRDQTSGKQENFIYGLIPNP
jgi:hypothetical protein